MVTSILADLDPRLLTGTYGSLDDCCVLLYFFTYGVVVKEQGQRESSGEWCWSLGLGYHAKADTYFKGLVLKVMIFEGVETFERSVQVEGRFLGHCGSGLEKE